MQNTSAGKDGDSIELFLEYRIYVLLSSYFVYVTSVPGLLNNPLTINLAFRLRLQSTSEQYMKIIGVTDLFNVVMRIVFYQPIPWTDIECMFTVFITNITYIYSNWVVVRWTIERINAVVFPLKLNTVHTRLALGSLFILCIWHTAPHLVYTVSVSRVSGVKGCSLVDIYYKYFIFIEHQWYMTVPMLIVFIRNIIIIYKVRLISNTRSMMSNKDTPSNRAKEKQ